MVKIPQAASKNEAQLALQMRVLKIEQPVSEHRFSPPRRWRFDFAWVDKRFAVEVEGITFGHGRHQRKQGFENDLEKYEAAMLQGWTVYRCSPSMIEAGTAVHTIAVMLEAMDGRERQAAKG